MKPTVKVSWSGGKDSTCAVLLHYLDIDIIDGALVDRKAEI